MGLVDGTNCGFCAAAPTADPGLAGLVGISNNAFAAKFTSPSDAAAVVEIGFFTYTGSTASAAYAVGIYAHDSGNNRPTGSPVGSASGFTKSASGGVWERASGLNITISPSTIYWVVVSMEYCNPACYLYRESLTGYRYTSDLGAAGTMPDPWTENDNPWERSAPLYALLGAGGPKIPVLMNQYRQRRS